MIKFTPKKKGTPQILKKEEEKKKLFKGKEEEEDDDDDDDDDDDLDDDSEDMEMSEVGSDEEEDSEQEDDDDDDDDEESDDEEVTFKQVNKSPQKNSIVNRTPQKNTPSFNQNSRTSQNGKAQQKTPQSQQQLLKNKKNKLANKSFDSIPVQQLNSESKKRKINDDTNTKKKPRIEDSLADTSKILHISCIPAGTNIIALKALSPDILSISRPNEDSTFAYFMFESKEVAKKNFQLLQNKRIKTPPIQVDFVKEENQQKDKERLSSIDPKRLFVGNLPLDVKEKHLKKIFPNSISFVIPQRKNWKRCRFAFADFKSEDDARNALMESTGKVVKGMTVAVLYAKASKFSKSKKRRLQKQKAASFQKNPKKQVKEDLDDNDISKDEDEDSDE